MAKRRTSPKLETRENTRELKKKERLPPIQRWLASNRNSGEGTKDEDDKGRTGGKERKRGRDEACGLRPANICR